MPVSHYVIEKILSRWNNLRMLKREFEKFARRYPDDDEFQEVYKEFNKYLRINSERLERIKEELKILEEKRKQESSVSGKSMSPIV
ncbi:MAG TPA: hypothetical protein EYP86_04725 [Candidatus Altiarchaeales archaeon]|nr:hypothetical protein [Candidatus Altiarchaeales archaeon]